jgi:monofunctional glycosyltransferase
MRWRRWLKWLGLIVVFFVIGSTLWVLAYRWIAPPTTPVRIAASLAGQEVSAPWTALEQISPYVVLGAIVAEDRRFCLHHGFDTKAIAAAVQYHRDGGPLFGASTISQQTARTVFLWQGRSWFRKGLEAWFTLLLETFWPKSRIVEVYLSTAEWGRGRYGIAAATEHFYGYGQTPANLSREQAAFLIVLLTSPRRLGDKLDDAALERKTSIASLLALPRIVDLAPCLGRKEVMP